MDFATLGGFVFAVAVVVIAIFISGEVGAMFNVPSMFIVVGGCAGCVLMRFSLKQFFGAFKIGLKSFLHKTETPNQMINQVLDLADLARKNGVLALEDAEIQNPFLKQGVQLIVDGLEGEIIETMLHKEMNLSADRHLRGQQIFKAIGDVAPAMGMIGTLIGLVQMLTNLSDPSSLGPAMAVAMLTTLYGAFISHIIALPIADKLALRSEEEQNIQSLIIDAVISIQRGQNPRIIKELLKSYLPGSKRSDEEISGDAGETEAAAA